jgi:rsbT co-antagonist protein RsbR
VSTNAALTGDTPDVIKAQLLGSIDELLSVLKKVATGDLSKRLEVKFDESHPVGALAISINSMVDALQEARARSSEYSNRLTEQVVMIERQQAAIQELSTPIIEVWTGALCVPIVGVLDSARATDLTATLLNTVMTKKAPFTIIDITGIEVMDTSTADHFIRMARSVRLLGAKCVLSGIRPAIARTIVHMGIDLSGIESYRTMREALRSYVQSTLRQNGHHANSDTVKNGDGNGIAHSVNGAPKGARTIGKGA